MDDRPSSSSSTSRSRESGSAASPLFSTAIDRAYRLAAIVHAAQNRKETKLPYISHPVHVARLLERAGCSEDVVVAGLLHDVLEDGDMEDASTRARLRHEIPAFTELPNEPAVFREALHRYVEEEFGHAVYSLVRAVSEKKTDGEKKRPWKERKLEQLAHVKQAGPDVVALKAADALHNAQSILADAKVVGAEVFERFNATTAETLWYYSAINAAVDDVLGPEHPLASALNEAVGALARIVGELFGSSLPPGGEGLHR